MAISWSAIIALYSCQNNLIDKVQGVYKADKTSLKSSLETTMNTNNMLASALLNRVIENAVVEFKIEADSIQGLIFIAGQSTIIKSKIQVRNDSLVLKSDNLDAHLIPEALAGIE